VTPQALLAEARSLPDELGAAGVRAAALLVRQALEGAVERAVHQAFGGECDPAPFTVKLLCFQRVQPGLGEKAAATWAGLSRACHLHGYELAPSRAAVHAWLEEVERLVRVVHAKARLVVHRSNRIEALMDAAVEVLRPPPDDPFQADAVVVHGPGLERWVSMQLADRLGVAANIHYPHPRALIGQLLAGPADRWSREVLRWALADALEHTKHTAFAPLNRWLSAGGECEQRVRLVELSGAIASVFERYATYRPHMVQRWEAGVGDGWEAPLWRAVAERLGGHDLAARLDTFRQGLPDANLEDVPGRILVFGVGSLAPLHLAVLAALATRREVHLMHLAATERGSASALPLHPLLASSGKLAAELGEGISTLLPMPVERPAFLGPGIDSVLHALQSDLLAGARPQERHTVDDRSIELHGCHGPMRQVQVLRDVLLRLLDQDPSLQERDIVVMTPDIERFAPLVGAVFGDGASSWARRAGHHGLPRLRHRLADRGVRFENPVAAALLHLLELAGSRLRATDVFDLLSRPPVRAHFGLSADDLTTCRTWLAQAGVRWGADASHRAAVGQPKTDLYTWRFGLDRLLLGSAMANDDQLWQDVLPTGEVEHGDSRAVLGGLAGFVDALLHTTTLLVATDDWSGWYERLATVLQSLVGSDPERPWLQEEVRSGLGAVRDAAHQAGFAGQLDRRAVLATLRGRFGDNDLGRGFLDGGITVCQMVPMRAVPFRVVCLLGMDDGAFPRAGGHLGFDRMAAEPMPGDRPARLDDRALFLEAILSARDRLVLLYTSRGADDDAPRAPAVVVGELVDVLDADFAPPKLAARCTRQHALQPFGDAELAHPPHSHDARMLAAALAARAPSVPPPSFLSEPLPEAPESHLAQLHQLSWFFRDPVTALFRSRLRLYPERDAEALKDREPLALGGGLDAWAVRDWLVQHAAEQSELARPGPLFARLRRHSLLPLGEAGHHLYDRCAQEAAQILERATPLRTHPLPSLQVQLPLRDWTLQGVLDRRFEAGRVEVIAGRVGARHRIGLWLQHLAMCAMGSPAHSWLLGHGSSAGFAPVDPGQAAQTLGELLQLRKVGNRVPLFFFPDTSLAYQRAIRAGLEPSEACGRAWSTWRQSHSEPSEAAARLLGGRMPLDERWLAPDLPSGPAPTALAEQIWGPALDATVTPP
jgi:exodeoxyribonuclease V gamma subunit